MSDVMLLGVLRMPMDEPDPMTLHQFVNRARAAADRIETDAAEIARLAAALRKANDQAEHFEREWYLAKDDAERYRWLRPRLRVVAGRAMSGTVRESLDVRVGQCFFDTPTRHGKGYLDVSVFHAECRTLDAEIDAAMAEAPAVGAV